MKMPGLLRPLSASKAGVETFYSCDFSGMVAHKYSAYVAIGVPITGSVRVFTSVLASVSGRDGLRGRRESGVHVYSGIREGRSARCVLAGRNQRLVPGCIRGRYNAAPLQ